MIDEIRQIKEMRKSLNLTQKDLAIKSGVSQSLIAKIESGLIDPAYSKVNMIMDALKRVSDEGSKTARDVMIKSIIKLKPQDNIKTAIAKMRKYSISQIPVFEEKQVVGLVSENFLLDALTDGYDVTTSVDKIMGEAPPTISPETHLDIIIQVLKQYPLVIVSEKGGFRGVITKADMFKELYK